MFLFGSLSRTLTRSALCPGLLLALTFSASALGASYTVTDLGVLGSGVPTAINASGQIVGYGSSAAEPGEPGVHSFLYSGGSMIDLGSLPGGWTTAFAINDKGQIVGRSGQFGPYLDSHAFLYEDGTMTDLGGLWGTSGVTSWAVGINNQGQIVGNHYDNTNPFAIPGRSTFLYANGSSIDLPFSAGTDSWAAGINNQGQVIANADVNSSGAYHAYLYSGGALTELGAFSATAINDSGQVAGCGNDPLLYSGGPVTYNSALLYSGGAVTYLGTVAEYTANTPPNISTAYCPDSINAAGQVLGTITFLERPCCYTKPWLYSDGVMSDLTSLIDPASGWTITKAGGINDAGQIAAVGCAVPSCAAQPFFCQSEPGCHLLLLTPVTTTVVEYQNTQDFPGSPGGHFFYTDNPGEQAIVDSGADGYFVRTGRTFKAGGSKRLCRFYGSVVPGPNSHFYTISDGECAALKALQQTPTPTDVQQWNYEFLTFSEVPAQGSGASVGCTAGAVPVYRAYNNAYPLVGPKNPWDSAHRYSTNPADIQQMVSQYGWRDEGIAFCAPQ